MPEEQPQDRSPSGERRETIPRTVWALADGLCQMPRIQEWKYFLVLVDTFSEWVEADSARTEKFSEVLKTLKELIPPFGLPSSDQSNNGTDFISEITQKVIKLLRMRWSLQTAWRPQASWTVEKMNHTLKKNIAKLCQETHLNWDQVLPVALLRIRVAGSSKWDSISLYEIVYGWPFQTMIWVGCEQGLSRKYSAMCMKNRDI